MGHLIAPRRNAAPPSVHPLFATGLTPVCPAATRAPTCQRIRTTPPRYTLVLTLDHQPATRPPRPANHLRTSSRTIQSP